MKCFPRVTLLMKAKVNIQKPVVGIKKRKIRKTSLRNKNLGNGSHALSSLLRSRELANNIQLYLSFSSNLGGTIPQMSHFLSEISGMKSKCLKFNPNKVMLIVEDQTWGRVWVVILLFGFIKVATSIFFFFGFRKTETFLQESYCHTMIQLQVPSWIS